MDIFLIFYYRLLHKVYGEPHDARGVHIDLRQLIPDYIAIVTSKDADDFFGHYGPGNTINGVIDKPYERAKTYEALLEALKHYSSTHYERVHKGTAYYFLGWLGFQIKDFEKGLFYMDAAISEDLRLRGPSYDISADHERSPAIKFLTLQEDGQVAIDAVHELNTAISDALKKFSILAGVKLSKEIFVNKCVLESGMFTNSTFRTILTSMYSFFTEYESRNSQLRLRSGDGGSIEPFITHLFKGCLVWESLLKLFPSTKDAQTAEGALKLLHRNDTLKVDTTHLLSGIKLEEVIKKMNQMEGEGKSFSYISINVSYALRNTTGHNLVWPDNFNEDTYKKLYQYVCGCILWTAYQLWVKPTTANTH